MFVLVGSHRLLSSVSPDFLSVGVGVLTAISIGLLGLVYTRIQAVNSKDTIQTTEDDLRWVNPVDIVRGKYVRASFQALCPHPAHVCFRPFNIDLFACDPGISRPSR